jgi:predicted kinase
MQAQNNRSIILIRGLPGSGKSTLANILSENGKYPVFSVDQYFTDDNGKYVFNYLDNHLAYEECKKNALSEIRNGTEKIFIDNTFTLDWEMEPYFKMAKENDYKIFVFTVENYHGSKNIHDISEEQVKKMAEKYNVKLLP